MAALLSSLCMAVLSSKVLQLWGHVKEPLLCFLTPDFACIDIGQGRAKVVSALASLLVASTAAAAF